MSDPQPRVNPHYLGGEPVRVAGGRNQPEAELIQNILLEEGIPSTLRRTRGFDVPDFLAAGPRDVLVPEAAYDAARELLTRSQALGLPGPEPIMPDERESPVRLFLWMMVALAAAAAIVFVLYRISS